VSCDSLSMLICFFKALKSVHRLLKIINKIEIFYFWYKRGPKAQN
jgi:hypothetical protein